MTLGAGAWRGDHVAAMMTGEAARQAMLHHPGGTIGALKTITAMPAKRERRITPPIEEQERLFALFQNRSEEHTSELQSLMRNSYAVFCLKKKSHLRYSM